MMSEEQNNSKDPLVGLIQASKSLPSEVLFRFYRKLSLVQTDSSLDTMVAVEESSQDFIQSQRAHFQWKAIQPSHELSEATETVRSVLHFFDQVLTLSQTHHVTPTQVRAALLSVIQPTPVAKSISDHMWATAVRTLGSRFKQ